MRIDEKAVLVKLSIGKPGNTRKDKKITGQVINANHLGDKSGRWVKALYPREAFDPVASIESQARTFHYENTLPWTDEGYRLLPTANHADYCAAMRKLRQEFETVSESHFIARLSEWEAWAREQHNGTFDQADYLPAEKLRGKFGFSTDFAPVPSGADFRVDIGDEDRAAMAAQVDSRVSEAVQTATKDLWLRLAAPLQAIVENMKPGEKPVFCAALIGNVRQIVELLPKLNVISDPNLRAFATQIGNEIAALDPKTLKEDKQAQTAAAAKAEEILAKMSGYFGGAK